MDKATNSWRHKTNFEVLKLVTVIKLSKLTDYRIQTNSRGGDDFKASAFFFVDIFQE